MWLTEMVWWCFADIIDENLKTALQKDLNAMAPGLTIQVLKQMHAGIIAKTEHDMTFWPTVPSRANLQSW